MTFSQQGSFNGPAGRTLASLARPAENSDALPGMFEGEGMFAGEGLLAGESLLAGEALCGESDGRRWYALTVRHQHERSTERALASKGWPTLLPTYRTQRRWSDRVKEIELPLFSGYVFCRFPLEQKLEVEETPGVAHIVEFGGAPAAMGEAEIAALQAILTSGHRLSPWPYLKAGDRVRVERGPLRGVTGMLIGTRDKGNKHHGGRGGDGEDLLLVVGVELLQRSVAIEVTPDQVVPERVRSSTAN